MLVLKSVEVTSCYSYKFLEALWYMETVQTRREGSYTNENIIQLDQRRVCKNWKRIIGNKK